MYTVQGIYAFLSQHFIITPVLHPKNINNKISKMTFSFSLGLYLVYKQTATYISVLPPVCWKKNEVQIHLNRDRYIFIQSRRQELNSRQYWSHKVPDEQTMLHTGTNHSFSFWASWWPSSLILPPFLSPAIHIVSRLTSHLIIIFKLLYQQLTHSKIRFLMTKANHLK